MCGIAGIMTSNGALPPPAVVQAMEGALRHRGPDGQGHYAKADIGMIQTRWGHLNRTYSLLTRVQAMFLDGHLLLEQTARSRSGRFFNFNGTAGLWRRS